MHQTSYSVHARCGNSAVQAPFAFGDWKSTTSSEALVLDPQPPIGTGDARCKALPS